MVIVPHSYGGKESGPLLYRQVATYKNSHQKALTLFGFVYSIYILAPLTANKRNEVLPPGAIQHLLLFCKSQVLPIDSIYKTPTASIVHSIDFNPLEIEGRIQKAILDSFLAVKHLLTQPLADLYQSPIQLKNGHANYSGNHDNTFFFDKPAYLQYVQLI